MPTKQLQTHPTFGYLGPQGTYSEEAAIRYFGSRAGSYKLLTSIEAVIRAVDTNTILEGIVPIENSLEGAVNITLDLLAHEFNLCIIGEIAWPVRHNLLAKTSANTIKTIFSHPQALAQCRGYLLQNYPSAEIKATQSTAEAAQIVATDSGPYAAIASSSASSIYGLSIVQADIQDNNFNCTRFVVIGKKPDKVENNNTDYKTSIICNIDGSRPGSLCEVLQEFSTRNVNLTRIESRPARTGLGAYIFFLDIEGSIAEPRIHAALNAIQLKSIWFKNLGSYPIMQV